MNIGQLNNTVVKSIKLETLRIFFQWWHLGSMQVLYIQVRSSLHALRSKPVARLLAEVQRGNWLTRLTSTFDIQTVWFQCVRCAFYPRHNSENSVIMLWGRVQNIYRHSLSPESGMSNYGDPVDFNEVNVLHICRQVMWFPALSRITCAADFF